MNTLTVNLHLLMVSFYRPTKERFKIIMEAGAFPSDQYAIESQVRFHGFEPKDAIIEITPKEGEYTLKTDDIIAAIKASGDEIALVLFGGINYFTGQLRESRGWENVKTRSYNREYLNYYKVPEWESDLSEELKKYMNDAELANILKKKNKAAQILALQSTRLRSLNEQGKISDLNYVEMQALLKELYDQQGKNERIKNFPYPRQFASINVMFVYLLSIVLPLGFLSEFSKIGTNCVWLTIPVSVVVGWVFFTLEQIGESTENPFEGNANDVPITSMSRAIEIDLRDMLGEDNLPEPLVANSNNILM